MRYQNGAKRDEANLTRANIALSARQLASRECFLIFSVFVLILCLPIVGLFLAGGQQ